MLAQARRKAGHNLPKNRQGEDAGAVVSQAAAAIPVAKKRRGEGGGMAASWGMAHGKGGGVAAAVSPLITVGSVCTGMGTCDGALDVLALWNPYLTLHHAFGCERSPVCRRVLHASYPQLHVYTDALTDLEKAPEVDVSIAGFPCQPFLVASRIRRGPRDPGAHVLPAILTFIEARRPRC